jgi:hypothetical protein
LPHEFVRGQADPAKIAKDILDAQGVRFQWHFRVDDAGFVSLQYVLFDALRRARTETSERSSLSVQRFVRMCLQRRRFLAQKRAATIFQAAFRGWKCRYSSFLAPFYNVQKQQKFRKELNRLKKNGKIRAVMQTSLNGVSKGRKNDGISKLENGLAKCQNQKTNSGTTLSAAVFLPLFQLPDGLNETMERIYEENQLASPPKLATITRYLKPLAISQQKPVVQSVSPEEFASKHLRVI